MDRLGADVYVVGAGFAGMSAAWRLHQAGRKVIVLKARDRVGGRTWTLYSGERAKRQRVAPSPPWPIAVWKTKR